MIMQYKVNLGLYLSACADKGLMSEEEILKWITACSQRNKYKVQLKPLNQLQGWSFGQTTGDFSHFSGKFFSIQGLSINFQSPSRRSWSQPIINQPEIGILGFIAKNFGGVLHLLVQAKMEPGNINFIQISPTVQSTKSNYSQVHGGTRPKFIEYFLEGNSGRVLFDQLQSEQGTRYFKKKNRNIIIEVSENVELTYSEDYAWVTLGQLQKLLRFDNLVHLDCRSIIGSLVYQQIYSDELDSNLMSQDKFSEKLRLSIRSVNAGSDSNMVFLLSWLTRLKCNIEIIVRLIPLNQVSRWSLRGGVIEHDTRSFFSVIGVEVLASNREVSGWHQPLISSVDGGIIGLICQLRNGVLHFLIQGLPEPGLIDGVELAATVQCTPKNYMNGLGIEKPPFVDLIQSESNVAIRFDSNLSDEGGRFYHSSQRHIVVELDEGIELDLPVDYVWMTLGQIQQFAQFSSLVNIELRSILACLSLID
jgi:oxidase EvaA